MSAVLDALRRKSAAGLVPVIPDFKMISPADGPLFEGRDPVAAAAENTARRIKGESVPLFRKVGNLRRKIRF